jgi:hypothetical protein
MKYLLTINYIIMAWNGMACDGMEWLMEWNGMMDNLKLKIKRL